MKATLSFIRNSEWFVITLAAAVCVAGFAGVVQAATTISTNISTGGTLSVTGASTLTGGVTVGSSGTALTKVLMGTCAVDPQSLAVGTSSPVSTSCAATGVTSAFKVFVTPPQDNISDDNWLVLQGASASTTSGYIEIQLFNASTTAAVNGSSRTWTWLAIQ